MYLTAPGVGSYTAELVVVGESNIYRIPVTITSSGAGSLEPTFSKLILTVEPNTVIYRTISFRNKYDDRIEIKDIQVLDGITTQEGTRPIAVKSAQLGWLDPGKDLTVEIEINTKKIEYPKTYNPKLIVVYYHNNQRREVSVQFQVNVQKSLMTVSKTMNLLITPSNPEPGDMISAILVGENNETIAGKIFITIYDLNGNKISQFQFLTPILAESGKKYCFKGEAEYYETVEKCVIPKFKFLRIELSVDKPKPNEPIIVKAVDLDGNIVPNAKLIIDGREYDSPQITAVFEEGTHTLIAEAPGMESVSTSIVVEPKLKILNATKKPRINRPFTLLLNKNVFYTIYFNNKEILNGTSSNITFIPKKVGNYTIDLGEKVYTFIPKPAFQIPIPSIPGIKNLKKIYEKYKIYIIIAVVVIVLLIILKLRKKKEEPILEIEGKPSLVEEFTIKK